MTLVYVGNNCSPNYTALSTDIVSSKISGASNKGMTVLTVDDGAWYVIDENIDLQPFALAFSFAGTVNVGTISLNQAGGNNGVVDKGAGWTSVYGVSGAAVVSADITTATAVTGAPASGQKLIITDILVSSDTDMNILFEEETSGTDLCKLFLKAGVPFHYVPRSKNKLAAADKKLTAKSSVSGNVGITVSYYSEA